MADFVYGNTRLRARRAAFLGPGDYEALVGLDADELLGALADTAYAPDVERAVPDPTPVRRLHHVVQGHLARVLGEMRGFYHGGARATVDLLLARWDLVNLIGLIRAQARGATVDEALAAIVPVGGIDEAVAREFARQRSSSAAITLLAAWRLPTPQDASALLAAWPEYERTHDLAGLETELTARHLVRVGAQLSRTGSAGAPVLATVQSEIDSRNVLAALRLREAIVGGELGGRTAASRRRAFMPGGRVRHSTLVAVSDARMPEDVVLVLDRDPAARGWRPLLARWVAGGELSEVQDAVEAKRTADALALFAVDDPLGAGIPVAFAAAAELEARNLRVVADAAARPIDPALTRARLVFL